MNPLPLQELILYTWKHSRLYRELWEKRGFNPNKDFSGPNDLKRVPITTKGDFLSMRTQKRALVSSKDYFYFVNPSSGTSATPLISLHERYLVPGYYNFIESMPQCRYSSVLVLRPGPYANAFIGAALRDKFYHRGSIIAIGDPRELTFSAHIAREISMDRLVGDPATVNRFARNLQAADFLPSRITFLHIAGEPLTSAAVSLLRKLYPNAFTLFTYGISESPSFIGIRSSLCSNLEKIHPNAYHLCTDTLVIEEVDGSLVITAPYLIPTPLIRYDTGDRIIVRDNFECSCGFPKGRIGIIGPRFDGKSYKIGTMALKAEAIQGILSAMSDFVTDDFVLQLEQIVEKGQLIVSPILTLRPAGSVPTLLITSAIQEIIENDRRIG